MAKLAARNFNPKNRFAEGSGGGCFRAGTKVSTPEGNINIEDLKVGQEIWAFDEQGNIRKANIAETHKHDDDKILRVEFWGGELFITPNHWVLNQYLSFVELGTLEPEDALIDLRGHLRPIKSITEVERGPVYNLTVLPYHTYIADGIRVHNGGGGKKGGGSARVPVESPNSLRSLATARVVDLIGEGVMGGLVNGAQSIFFDDTPLENEDGSINFQGVTWDMRYGYPDQEPMPGFDEIENETVVEAEITRQNGALVRQIDAADTDAIRLRIRYPNLSFQEPTTGDLKPTDVELRVEVKPNTGDWRNVPIMIDEQDRTGNTTTGANTIGFSAVVKKRILVKLNSTAQTQLELRYRRVGASAWQSLGVRNVSQIIRRVANPAEPDGYIDGQPAYYHTFTATYVQEGLGNSNYEIGMVQGDEITSFKAYRQASLKVEGKNTSPTEKSFRFSLPGEGPWQIRVSRITPDSDTVNLQNATYWSSYTAIIEEKLIYPDSCYIGLAVNSELFGSNIPQRAYDVYGREVMVPSNYNPLTRMYDGFWDGTFRQAWTDNPAWCFLDMLTNDRFGLGHIVTVDNVDTAKLYEIAQYCDELVPDGYGGLEPRFTLNCVINTRVEAYQLLNTLVSVFRGMSYWASGSVGFGIDAPRETDVLVTRANVINGEFNYQTTSDKAQHNSILVTWNDPNDADRPNIEVVEDNRDIAARGLRQTDVYAYGCKSRGMANRLGRWILFTENNEIESVTYRASLDHLNVVPGMIANIADPQVAGAEIAGRTMNISGTEITLDREVEFAANESYELQCIDDDGHVQKRAIVSASGQTTDTIEIATPFSPEPTKGKVWAVIGTDVEPRPFRIISIVEAEPNIFEISGIEYNPSKHEYVDRERKLEPIQFTRYSSGQVQPPENLDIRETLFKANNQLKTRVTISWTGGQDNRVYLYKVLWRNTNGGIFQEKYTSDEAIELIDIEPGVYDFYVHGMAAAGQSTPLYSEAHEILGKTAPPADVQNLRAERKVNGVILSWDAVTDLDLIGYEVRRGTNWDTAEYVADITGTSLFVDIADNAETTFLVRAKDQLEILSSNVTSIVSSVIAPLVPPMFTAVPQADMVLFRWTRVPGIDNTYEIRRGVDWLASEVIGISSGDEMLILDPQRDTAIYWIKSKSTAGLYSDTARAASAIRALIPDRNVIIEYDNQNDGGAGLYPGYTFNMEQGPDDSLVLAQISEGLFQPYGEHYFTHDLGQTIRARNWLETSLLNIAGTGPTWEEWEYPWNDMRSQISWLPLADLDGAQVTKVIAWKRDPLDVESYAFSFQNHTDDFRGIVVAAEEIGVTYGPAKFGNGMFVSDLTKVSYDLDVSETFSMIFKLRIENRMTNKLVFAVFKNDAEGDKIELGYDAAVQGLYALDSEGNYFTLPIPQALDTLDFLAVGFVQDTDKRILYYKSEREYLSVYEQADIPPLENTFDKLYLYHSA